MPLLLLTNAFGCTLVLSCSFCCLSHIIVVVVDSLGWSLAHCYHCLSLSVVVTVACWCRTLVSRTSSSIIVSHCRLSRCRCRLVAHLSLALLSIHAHHVGLSCVCLRTSYSRTSFFVRVALLSLNQTMSLSLSRRCRQCDKRATRWKKKTHIITGPVQVQFGVRQFLSLN
jgi:hypothetical protein